jgi:hypothetical protein
LSNQHVQSGNFLVLAVGEFIKTCHPLNVEVNEICDARFQGQRTHKVWKSRMRGDLESRILEVSESRTRDGSES